MDKALVSAYRFFREHGGSIVGESARCALALARAERDGEAAGLTVQWEEESEEYETGDAETERPRYVLCAFVSDPDGGKFSLAALGMIGLNDLRDPYRRVVAAELLLEALDTLAENREKARLARQVTCPACGHTFEHVTGQAQSPQLALPFSG